MVLGSANINYVLPENIEQHILDGYKLIDVREDDEGYAGEVAEECVPCLVVV